MNFLRFTKLLLAPLALSGLSSCITKDVDCYSACIPDPVIIDFEKGITHGSRFVEGDLTQTFENGQWRITGNAGGASFGIRFHCVAHALYYDGIRLSAHSDAAPVVRLRWELQTVTNEPSGVECTSPGKCQADECKPAANNITLSPSFSLVRDFGTFGAAPELEGAPDVEPFAGELIGMRWRIPDDAGEVNVVIDELRFARTDEGN
jgi:hypothetical protein